MRRSLSLVQPVLLPLLAWAALVGLPTAGRSEPPKPSKIVFETFDKAELQGTWYPSSVEGTKSPCVILLHRIGGNRLQEGWESLAQALQEKGFAVMSFDFRGHGDSTTVRPEFWAVRPNTANIRGANPKKESISFKEFSPNYYSMLVNDLAAAKLAVEQKNNARECNSADVMIVGAEEGAALGLLWMASEQRRYKKNFDQLGRQVYNTDPEAKDLAGLVCLSLRPTLGGGSGGVRLPYTTIFNNAKMRELPMCFFYGDEDAAGKQFALTLYDKVLAADRNKLKLTFKVEMEKTKLAGHELLGKKALGTEELVAKYLADKVRDARPAKVWGERDVGGPGRPNLNPLTAVPLGVFGINQ
ncbi:MAG: hypothetical protein JNM56_33225 [Planctomycetia bacterium]|nr:hypothetical protein [Planctomycetia bacterium]